MFFSTKNLAALAAAVSLTSALPTQPVKRGFSATANNNVAVWWGNSPSLTPLADICKDSTSDIVILTFAGYSGGKWTTVGNTAAANDIKACQSNGKKVMMSIGGETGSITWSSADEAKSAADSAASAFLSSSGQLGVALDGIDLDIENKAPAHWDDFTKELRSKMKTGQYISAAPQCPSPDASLPFDVLNLVDFVWVQYYNNPGCGHGSSGFEASVKDWSSKLTKAQFYIASPGSSNSAGSGFLDAAGMAKEIANVKAMNLKNFGGYAVWDASTAKANGDYAGAIKKALGGNTGSTGGGSGTGSSSAEPSSTPSKTAGSGSQSSAEPTIKNQQGGSASTPTAPAGAATTVKATSTAHVTSTAYAANSPAAATPTMAATSAIATGSPATPSGATGGNAATGNTQQCPTDGAIVCSPDGKEFGMCYQGSATMMALSAGTKCAGGSIVASE